MSDLANINDLTAYLKGRAEGDEVLFEAVGDDVGRGYHLTELRLARISSIDCGGVTDAWDEAQMQVLDAPGDTAMSAGKMTAILSRSAAEIDGLAAAPLKVEFSPGNEGLGRYQLGTPRSAAGVVTIPLTPMSPECKVMTRAFAKPAARECCGPAKAEPSSRPSNRL